MFMQCVLAVVPVAVVGCGAGVSQPRCSLGYSARLVPRTVPYPAVPSGCTVGVGEVMGPHLQVVGQLH